MAKRRVLLVGWDAADWKVARPLMAAGEMPNLARLVSGGASGNLATLSPPLSPMLWGRPRGACAGTSNKCSGRCSGLPTGSGR